MERREFIRQRKSATRNSRKVDTFAFLVCQSLDLLAELSCSWLMVLMCKSYLLDSSKKCLALFLIFRGIALSAEHKPTSSFSTVAILLLCSVKRSLPGPSCFVFENLMG
jgi:hypothetical protein